MRKWMDDFRDDSQVDLMSEGPDTSSEVRFERRGRLGVITLDRPRAINALTHDMVVEVSAALDVWAEDDAVQTVLVQGEGDRGLCAGGDIVSVYRNIQAGNFEEPALFWHDEYRMNAKIARYPKPYVAMMDGIVLGGGIGISAHGSHRVVTERSRLGLPETGIGFIPDVGSTWLLSHAPGELGTYLALTADPVRAEVALVAGLADFFVPSTRLPQLVTLLESNPPDEAISELAESAPVTEVASERELVTDREWIDEAFSADTVAEILGRLRGLGTEAATHTANRIVQNSPLALTVALESLRRARRMSTLEEALDQEYRVSTHSTRTRDFVEGVRAQVIDKDRSPRWDPPSLAEVEQTDVEAYFAPVETPVA
jgi:enoyl-CoA hydratase